MNTDFLKPVLMRLNSNSTQSSPMKANELNDSIEYYLDKKDYQLEIEIVKYLHGLGVQTKTDPSIKEQQYWNERRQKSQLILETFTNTQGTVVLNSTINRLLQKNVKKQDEKSQNSFFLLDQL